MALADESSPVFVARGMNTLGSMYIDMQKTAKRVSGQRRDELGRAPPVPLRAEPSGSSGPVIGLTCRHSWIPALDGVEAKLKAGARVADVGCGHGASVVAMAERLPELDVPWVRLSCASIETCRAAGARRRRERARPVRGRVRDELHRAV